MSGPPAQTRAASPSKQHLLVFASLLLLLLLHAPSACAKPRGSNHTSNWAVLVATSKVSPGCNDSKNRALGAVPLQCLQKQTQGHLPWWCVAEAGCPQ